MPTVVTIANQKGGPGKTTTAINLACGLEGAGYRVNVIDLDPQANFLRWNRRRNKAGMQQLTVHIATWGMMDGLIQELRSSSELDVIVIDCPGHILELTMRAVELSDAVLCPVRATSFDFEATQDMAAFLKDVRGHLPDIRFLLFINAKHGARNIDKGARENLIRLFGSQPNTRILDTEIPDAAPIAEFGGTGQSIFEYAPKTTAARLYKKLTKEVVECLAASA